MSQLMILSLAILILPVMALSRESNITIAQDSKSIAVIVLADNSPESDRYAAEELKYYLDKVTGADFRITNKYSTETPCLMVGFGAARLLDKGFSTKGLGIEGIVIRSVGKDLILAGGASRGTLYAVYTFLEDQIGCHWWAPDESSIPGKPTLQIPALNIRYVPRMEYREPYWGNQLENGEWCARNKINGARVNTDSRKGGHITEIGSVHSFYPDIHPNTYFKDHPDWYSEIKGKRVGDNAQLCMTSEGLIQEYSRIIKEKIRTHPGVDRVWISQNDWGGYCECKACNEINQREGTPAGALIHFVNAIAKEVGHDFPDVAINTLAYEWSQKPPKAIKPEKNVVIWLCTTGCKYNVPYTHTINREFRKNLDGWAKICDRIYIWDYTTNYSAYLCPHPNLRTLGPNMKYFASHGVRGVFSLGSYSAPKSEMQELRSWVTAKLLWNPSLKADRLIDEFLDGYYGPSGKYIKSYLNVFHDAIESTGEMLYMCEQPVGWKWLNARYLSKAMKYMQLAKAAAKDNPELQRRVKIAELPLLYVYLVGWDALLEESQNEKIEWPFKDETIKQVYDRFQGTREKNGITLLSESNARDVFESVQERVTTEKPSTPPGCENIPQALWTVIQPNGFTRNTYITSIVEDSAASNGTALYMPGNSDERLVNKATRRIPIVYSILDKEIRVKIRVRVELSGHEGIAFKYGMDTENRSVEIKASDIQSNEYYVYDFGTFKDLRGWGSLWISPANNPNNVKGVWLDRMWLVREQ